MTQIPLYQLCKNFPSGTWSGVDYFYTVDRDEAQRAVTSLGYTLQRIVGVAYAQSGPGLVQFKRYVQNAFHFYTTDPAVENLAGWTEETSAAPIYIVDPSTATTDSTQHLQRFLSTNQSGIGHFYSADLEDNPAPAGWNWENFPQRTGLVGTSFGVTLEVSYDMSGSAAGVSIGGGNAVGERVTVGLGSTSRTVTLTAEDVLIPVGVGNCIHFMQGDPGDWHFQSVSVASSDGGGSSRFTTLMDADDKGIHLIDQNLASAATGTVSYEYTLSIYDEDMDQIITVDPKIINRPNMI